MTLKGKTCLITGATSGIGKVTAIKLAKEEAFIVLASRNLEKGEKTKQEIIDTTGNKNIEVMFCDLASMKSIRDFVGSFKEKYNDLHILINNAGLWEFKRKESEDGIEMNFAVNHLAPFLFTNLLLDLLRNSAPARIINVSSMAHKMTKVNFDDIEGKKSWNGFKSYSMSKLCNILFTKKLSNILEGTAVTVNCLHPGLVSTALFNKMNKFLKNIVGYFMITPEKGAETSIYLATSDEVKNISGEYFVKKKIASPSKAAKDQKAINKLWDLSLKYTEPYLNY